MKLRKFMANVKRSLCTHEHAPKKHTRAAIGKEQGTRTKSTKITVEKANRKWIENIPTERRKRHGTKNTFESLWYRCYRRDQRRLICCKTFSLLIAYLQSVRRWRWLASPRHFISICSIRWLSSILSFDIISMILFLIEIAIFILPSRCCCCCRCQCQRMPNRKRDANYERWNGCCECGGNYMVRC